ncbi:hypothetical protein D3C81_876910 [compost metagenome]
MQGPSSEGTVEIDLTGLKNGNVAGFGIFEFPYAFVAVEQIEGKRRIIMSNDDKIIEIKENLAGDKLWVRARITDRGGIAKFYYSTDGENFYVIGNDLTMQLGLPWTANRFALFNYSKTSEGVDGYADFNWFRFTNK